MSVLDANLFALSIDGTGLLLTYEGAVLSDVDAVIPRIGASLTPFSTAILRHFEQQGVFVMNPADAIVSAIDKFCSLQILSASGVCVPQTIFAASASNTKQLIDTLGGAPVVLKLLQSTKGIGVMLADSTTAAVSIVDTIHSLQQHVVMQQFVTESRGQDIRAFVLNGEVIAAMRRCAKGQEFRSNLHRGGIAESVELEPEYEKVAIQAATAIGLRVAGVDMLVSHDGPKVIEVNASPGLEGIEKHSGLDIATMIIQSLESLMNLERNP